MTGKKKVDIKSRELKVLSDKASKNTKGAGWKLRIVQYYKDGKSIAVKLESGEYFLAEDGSPRFKAKGLSKYDVKELLKSDEAAGKRVIQVVYDIMENPPEVPSDEAPAEQKTFGEDEAPFS